MLMKAFIRNILFLFIFGAAVIPLWGAEEELGPAWTQALKLEKAGAYRKAAKAYMEAHLLTDDKIVKMNALRGAARSHRKNKMYGAEFDCLNRLLNEHLQTVEFQKIVDRQYEIANAYFSGHRDAAVFWLPIIPDKDRTMEFYETALKNAPCANQSAE